ncbi:MAG: acetate--CoA ligase family protein, partial [Oligoflexia bacterium]|nr:acetate--CoA ligase family protein [Oligoflexia bacterium]
HEVYRVLGIAGIRTPSHVFIPYGRQAGSKLNSDCAEVVVKVVSPDILHKSDAGGVMFCNNDPVEINKCIDHINNAVTSENVRGVIVAEKIGYSPAMGHELIVSAVNTADFGTVLGFGLGGLDTELYGNKMDNAFSVLLAEGPISMNGEITSNIAYKKLTGKIRGSKKLVTDDLITDVLEKLRKLLAEFPEISECEVNPMVVSGRGLVAVDGLIKTGTPVKAAPARPVKKLEALFYPESIAIAGVSTKVTNMGSIILDNIIAREFSRDKIFIVKPDADQIGGVKCFPSVKSLPVKVSVFVIAVSAKKCIELAKEIVNNDRAENIILIPGGFGETRNGIVLEEELHEAIDFSRKLPSQGPLVVGGNCLGVMSAGGKYDTFFIPKDRMEYGEPLPYAFISQSGAFIISKISKTGLTPAYAVSIGNQTDLVISDYLNYFSGRNDVKCVALYIEGFRSMDALKSANAVRELRKKGRSVVVYKAGRTGEGKAATNSHTASISSDYDIFRSVFSDAGAFVAETACEFEDMLTMLMLAGRFTVSGGRIAFVGNAGFEAVTAADNAGGGLSVFNDNTVSALKALLAERNIEELVSVNNPLDITPAADDALTVKSLEAVLTDPSVDAAVLSCIPMSPILKTPGEDGSIFTLLNGLWQKSPKPFVVAIDSGSLYDAACAMLKGQPVFRETDRAVRALLKYMNYKSSQTPK